MRSLSGTLTTAQKSGNANALVKIVLTQGVNSYTYTRSRIKSISHSEDPYRQTAEILLDNSDKTFSTLDLKGYKGVISYGLITSAGEEYSACAPLYVIAQQLYSFQGGLLCSLSLAGIPNLLDGDRANAAYTPTDEDIKTVKDLLTELIKAVLPARANSTAYVLDDLVIASPTNGYTYKCTTAGTSAASAPTWPTTIANTVTDGTVVWTNQGKELTMFSHTTAYTPSFDSEDALIDVYMPKDSFQIIIDSSRLEAIKRLVGYTKNVLRVEADEKVHILVPTTTGTVYNYEYKLSVTGEHNLFSKTLRQRLVIPNYIVVKSAPSHTVQYSGFAEDTESSALIPKRQYNLVRLPSNAQATTIAEAILARYQRDAETGTAKVPMNVGAEVHDYIKVTDARENDTRVGNIGHMERNYKPGLWEMSFRFGNPEAGGALGTKLTPINSVITETTGKPPPEETTSEEDTIQGQLDTLQTFIVKASVFYSDWLNSLTDMIIANKNTLDFLSITEPATPDAGEARLYVDRTTGKLYKKNSDGTIVDLEDCGVLADIVSRVTSGLEVSLDTPDMVSRATSGLEVTLEAAGVEWTVT